MATGPQVFRPGVKYVKLAKFDTGSVSSNLTTPLGEIKKIRVNYSDKGIIEYPIQTISEYPDYYLYRVATTDATSSTDNDTPDFNAVLESAFYSRGPGIGNIVSDDLGATTITSSNVSYNSTSGEVVFSKSTQIQMVLSASLETNTSTGNLNLVSNKRGVIYTAETLGSPATASITSLFTPFTDEVLTLTYTDTGSGGAFQTVRWSITTGSGAYTVTDGTQIPTVLEPFFESKFTNGDCDVLLGNATGPRLSTLYFDIDYSTSQVAPVNLQAILSGSATRAQTPDSNYTSIRSITPRYEGSKNTDPVPLQTVTEVYPGFFISSSGPFDRQLIQSTSSLAPLNNYVSAIVEYEDISIAET